jgi:hypothetical protein
MSSDFDDIMKELRYSREILMRANGFLSKEYFNQSEERKSVNRLLVSQNNIVKEVYAYLEGSFE